MAGEHDASPGSIAVRLIINLGGLGLAVATVALIVATIVVEID